MATRSRLGTGSMGSRMPTTTTYSSFIMIFSPGPVMPRRSATTVPSTVTGRCSPAPSSQTPSAISALRAPSRSGRTAWRVTPAACSSGTTSLRRIRASTSAVAVAVACRTSPMRCTMATALFGSFTSCPRASLPASAVSRLVPRRSSRSIRSARLEVDSPTTATIVAMPIAIPRADRTTRARRARRPTAPTARTSRAESRAGFSALARAVVVPLRSAFMAPPALYGSRRPLRRRGSGPGGAGSRRCRCRA